MHFDFTSLAPGAIDGLATEESRVTSLKSVGSGLEDTTIGSKDFSNVVTRGFTTLESLYQPYLSKFTVAVAAAAVIVDVRITTVDVNELDLVTPSR